MRAPRSRRTAARITAPAQHVASLHPCTVTASPSSRTRTNNDASVLRMQQHPRKLGCSLHTFVAQEGRIHEEHIDPPEERCVRLGKLLGCLAIVKVVVCVRAKDRKSAVVFEQMDVRS